MVMVQGSLNIPYIICLALTASYSAKFTFLKTVNLFSRHNAHRREEKINALKEQCYVMKKIIFYAYISSAYL